jgi:RNA polymerase sigma-70 factor, ECF subfamily
MGRMADAEQFLPLFMPVQGDLLAYILSVGIQPHDADDVFQNASIVLYKKFADYRSGTNFRAWAFAIVRHEVLKCRRSYSRWTMRLSDEAIDDLAALAEDEQRVPPVRLKNLTVCLERLGDQARRLMMMRYWDGKSVEDMATALGRPVTSLYTSLSRIRKSLQNCVQGEPASTTIASADP